MKKLISALLIVTMLMSIVCVSTAADEGSIIINENFASMEGFMQNFVAGAFYVEDGLLFGYKEARTFMTNYDQDEGGLFIDTATTWLTYDSEVTLAIGEDEFGDVDDRHISITYCNDNLAYEGRADGRVYFNFSYNVPTGEFTLTAGGCGSFSEEEFLVAPVAMEVPTDGTEFFTLGMSVGKDRIRCYYNDELIFDYQDANSTQLIAYILESPFLLWNTNNFVQVKNVTIATEGHLFPYGEDPVPTETTVTTEPDPTPTEGTVTTEPIGGGNDEPIGGGNDEPIGGGNDEPIGGGNDEPIGGGNDEPIGGGNDEPIGGGNDEPIGGGNDEPIAGGDDVPDTVGTTGTQRPSTNTGDATLVVVIAMVAALGSALIVKKVRG